MFVTVFIAMFVTGTTVAKTVEAVIYLSAVLWKNVTAVLVKISE